MATYFGKEYTNIGTESNPIWQAAGGASSGASSGGSLAVSSYKLSDGYYQFDIESGRNILLTMNCIRGQGGHVVVEGWYRFGISNSDISTEALFNSATNNVDLSANYTLTDNERTDYKFADATVNYQVVYTPNCTVCFNSGTCTQLGVKLYSSGLGSTYAGTGQNFSIVATYI